MNTNEILEQIRQDLSEMPSFVRFFKRESGMTTSEYKANKLGISCH